MIRSPDPEPAAELTTIRLGGRSARLVAVIIGVVLVSVVYVGVTGRHDVRPSPSTAATDAPALIAVPPTSSSTPGATVADEYPGAAQISGQGPPDRHLTLGLDLTVAGKTARAWMTQIAPHTLHASYLLPLPVPAASVTLALLDSEHPAPYGTWQVPIDGLGHGQIGDYDVGAFAPTRLVVAKGSFRPGGEGASRAHSDGFRIEVTGSQTQNADILNVTVLVGLGPVWPNDAYEVVALAGGAEYRPTSQDQSPGLLIGQFEVYGPIRAKRVVLELRAMPGADPLLGFAPIARYEMKVPRRGDVTGDDAFVEDIRPPDASSTLAGILRAGFTWRSSFSTVNGARILSFELVVNPINDAAV